MKNFPKFKSWEVFLFSDICDFDAACGRTFIGFVSDGLFCKMYELLCIIFF